MLFSGKIRAGRRTKDLAKMIQSGEIALIHHKDLDEVAALSLVNAKLTAVINTAESISGKYPNRGPSILLENHIFLLDVPDGEILWTQLQDGDGIEVDDACNLFKSGEFLCKGRLINGDEIERMTQVAQDNLHDELERFIDNTIEYAKKEKGMILGDVTIPQTRTQMEGRHVLIVIRGKNYKEDLNTIKSYIDEVKPVLIGVDGGGDALLEFGLIPDIVLGDMDSISDHCLKKAREIVVHAYPDGRAPGNERVLALGLKSILFPSPGTSEDIAMLMAYEKQAQLIVAVGTHSSMIDFLEKGRKGMASTFLVRQKIGYRLIDARGVSLLYRGNLKLKYLWWMIVCAIFPILVLVYISTPMQQLLKILEIKIRMMIN